MSLLSPIMRRRQRMSLLPTLADRSIPSPVLDIFPSWRPLDNHLIRVEDRMDGDRYTVLAELPGIDPERQVDVSVSAGQLNIKAERTETRSDGTRSEFSYGSFYRSIPLPPGADENDIDATYENGVLKISMPVPHETTETRHIAVKNAEAPNLTSSTDADRDAAQDEEKP